MNYIIRTTNIFDKWLSKIKDTMSRARIIKRFDYIGKGNFGDYKALGSNLFELRFFFGPGYRIYYTIEKTATGMSTIVLLLCGGDKSSQNNDIEKAKAVMVALE
ncbi:MAG: addiction module antitoxin RelB [Desulfobacteraceae bacterium 4572_19]|nr:MAG: addiction module antitoxin RelB [Desulfobacteraceae bacterium 4572_19]